MTRVAKFVRVSPERFRADWADAAEAQKTSISARKRTGTLFMKIPP